MKPHSPTFVQLGWLHEFHDSPRSLVKSNVLSILLLPGQYHRFDIFFHKLLDLVILQKGKERDETMVHCGDVKVSIKQEHQKDKRIRNKIVILYI